MPGLNVGCEKLSERWAAAVALPFGHLEAGNFC
jgi:hypothetical protein